MIFTAEETLGMSGVLLLVYALLRYLDEHAGAVRVRFGAAPAAGPTATPGEAGLADLPGRDARGG
jgi:hypothetical protein